MLERAAGEGSGRGRAVQMRARLARAIGRTDPDGGPALQAALREYVRAATDAGLGVRAMLADVEGAWRGGSGAAGGALTRDVLEVAMLLELSARDEMAPRDVA